MLVRFRPKGIEAPHSYRALPDSPFSTLPYLIPEVPGFLCHPDRRHELESDDTDEC